MSTVSSRFVHSIHVLGSILVLVAVALSQLSQAQSGDPNADAMKQLQQMQNDPRYKQMMDNPQVRDAMQQATKNASKTPAVVGGVARTGLPKRDEARLATVRRVAPSSEQLRVYVANVHAAVMSRLPADQRASVRELITELQAEPAGTLEAAASNVWIMGHPDLGVVLMGQAAADHPNQAGTLNNYAAFLTMLGAEPQAIPILQRLAADYPNNSTVQSNLGQAWFGLGDIAEAKKHLDAAVRIFPGHSQANLTIADIDEAQGDPVGEAQALEHSIESSYSQEKADRLAKLGKMPPPQRIPWRVHMAQDPMGLEQFKTPAFCKGVDDAKDCEARWQSFQDEISSKNELLEAKEKKLEQQIKERATKASAGALAPKASMTDMMAAANNMATAMGMDQWSPMQPVAQPRYHAALDDLSNLDAKIKSDTESIWAQENDLVKQFGAKEGEINKRYEPLFGEGEDPGIEKQYCEEIDKVEQAASSSVNPLLENIYQIGRPRILRTYNDFVYYAQFENDDLDFELIKVQTQRRFLGWLSTVHGAPYEGSRCTKAKPKKQSTVLQDFYDVHCEHIITFSVPKVGSFEVHCNKMITKLDLSAKVAGVGLNLKTTTVENLDTEQFISGRVEIGGKVGVDTKVGPVSAEASASGKGFIEFDDHHVTNVGGDLSGSAGVGPATVTVDTSAGWNSGSSNSGAVTLGGMTVKSF